ncbi:MAG: carboxypeptidase-like regulatory domain-containing protein [Actinomycetota bacterium]
MGPFANELHAVDGVSADDVWAVGAIDPGPNYNSRATLAMRFDGSSWTVLPTPNPDGSETGVDVDQAGLSDVEALSATDVWAVGTAGSIDNLGAQPVMLHWDGTAWSPVPVPRLGTATDHNGLSGIAAVSSTDVWAVGPYTLYGEGSNTEYGTLILHWNGSTWSLVPNPCNATEDVVAISSTDVWAVGDDTCHWDGSAWTAIPNAPTDNPGSYARLRSVSATSSGDVWAVGFRAIPYFEGYLYSSRIERWDGSQWTALPIQPGDHLDGVLALSAGDAWAVGSDFGLNLVMHWDGSEWSTQEVPSLGDGSYLNAVGAAGADLWAAGIYFVDGMGRTATLRRSGSTGGSVAILKGAVRSTSGQTIPGAKVSWRGPQTGSTTTNARGGYQMTSASGGSYSITASASGCQSRKALGDVERGPDGHPQLPSPVRLR